MSIEMPFIQPGRKLRGVVQDDNPPQTIISQLADYMAAWRFLIARAITFCDLADINRVAEEPASGKTIQPVLRMPH